MTSAYDIVDCDGSKGFPASDAIASYSHEYIDEFDNNRFTPLMSVDSKKFAERERCVVIPEKLFSDLIGTDPKSMDAEVTRATLVAVEQIVNRDLEILLSSAKDAIAGIKNDPDVSFDMLKKYKIPFERTRVATRLWFRESTPDVLGIHIYVYPDGDVDNVALLNNPERIVGTDLTEREYPLIDYLIIPLVARVVFDAFTVHIANAGLADEDECRLMVSVTLGYHPRDALRRSMLVKKVPVRDNLGVVLADTQHIGYTYSWLGFLGKKAWNPTLLDFSTIFESKPQTEAFRQPYLYGISTIPERAHASSTLQSAKYLVNPCMPGLVTTNRLTTVLSASVAHANALRERLYNETAFYSKVAFILERLLANAGETFDALKKLVKTWDEADVTFEDHVQSKVLCATEILAYTAELDGNQIWEIDSSMITEQRWRFLKAVFDISKFDMLALAKLLGSVFGIPIRCNDTFGGKQEYFYVIPEELAKSFFSRVGFVTAEPRKYREQLECCETSCAMPSTKEPSLQAQIEKYEKMDAELRATIVAESAKNEKLTKALAASEAEYVKKLESAAGSSTKPSTEDVAALKKLEYIVEQQQEELKRNAMKIQDLTTDLEEQRQQTEQAKMQAKAVLIDKMAEKEEEEGAASPQPSAGGPPPPPPPPPSAPGGKSERIFMMRPADILDQAKVDKLLKMCVANTKQATVPPTKDREYSIPMENDPKDPLLAEYAGQGMRKFCALSGKPFYVTFYPESSKSARKFETFGVTLPADFHLSKVDALGPTKYGIPNKYTPNPAAPIPSPFFASLPGKQSKFSAGAKKPSREGIPLPLSEITPTRLRKTVPAQEKKADAAASTSAEDKQKELVDALTTRMSRVRRVIQQTDKPENLDTWDTVPDEQTAEPSPKPSVKPSKGPAPSAAKPAPIPETKAARTIPAVPEKKKPVVDDKISDTLKSGQAFNVTLRKVSRPPTSESSTAPAAPSFGTGLKPVPKKTASTSALAPGGTTSDSDKDAVLAAKLQERKKKSERADKPVGCRNARHDINYEDLLPRIGKCVVCGNPTTSWCGRCRAVAYCSVECQGYHWATHAGECAKAHKHSHRGKRY